MPHPPQALPSDATMGGAIAREIAFLRGPGYQPSDGTLIAADTMVLGDAVAAVVATQQSALDQAFPNTADVMLTEWETRLGVPTDPNAATADRQAAITAKRRAAGGGNATRVLAAVRAIAPEAVLFLTTVAQAAATSSTAYPTVRQVFQWAVKVLAATWADPRKLARLQDIVHQMAPAHTSCSVITNEKFSFDDSLFDRDVFGL